MHTEVGLCYLQICIVLMALYGDICSNKVVIEFESRKKHTQKEKQRPGMAASFGQSCQNNKQISKFKSAHNILGPKLWKNMLGVPQHQMQMNATLFC